MTQYCQCNAFAGNVRFDGRVGVGTDVPFAPLEVVGSPGETANDPALIVGSASLLHQSVLAFRAGHSGSGGPNAAWRWFLGSRNSVVPGGSNQFVIEDAYRTERLAITQDGYVGIGAITPVGKLDIQGFAGSGETINAIADATYRIGSLSIKQSGPAVPTTRLTADTNEGVHQTRLKSLGHLSFHTGNTDFLGANERVTILGFGPRAGNVGVGTTLPVSPLEAVGKPGTTANDPALVVGSASTQHQSLLAFRAGHDGSGAPGGAWRWFLGSRNNVVPGGGQPVRDRGREPQRAPDDHPGRERRDRDQPRHPISAARSGPHPRGGGCRCLG